MISVIELKFILRGSPPGGSEFCWRGDFSGFSLINNLFRSLSHWDRGDTLPVVDRRGNWPILKLHRPEVISALLQLQFLEFLFQGTEKAQQTLTRQKQSESIAGVSDLS